MTDSSIVSQPKQYQEKQYGKAKYAKKTEETRPSEPGYSGKAIARGVAGRWYFIPDNIYYRKILADIVGQSTKEEL